MYSAKESHEYYYTCKLTKADIKESPAFMNHDRNGAELLLSGIEGNSWLIRVSADKSEADIYAITARSSKGNIYHFKFHATTKGILIKTKTRLRTFLNLKGMFDMIRTRAKLCDKNSSKNLTKEELGQMMAQENSAHISLY